MISGFGETRTWYMGKREKVATVFVDNIERELGLSGTRECARSLESAQKTLSALTGKTVALEQAKMLQEHCRTLVDYKEGFRTKENPNGVKRDKPRVKRRQFYL